MMTRKEIENGEGRYTEGRTIVLQHGADDLFDTAQKSDGVKPGWHIAGWSEPGKQVEWVDLW